MSTIDDVALSVGHRPPLLSGRPLGAGEAGRPGPWLGSSPDLARGGLGVHVQADGWIYALGPVTVLAGLRPADRTADLLQRLDCPRLARVRMRMDAVPAGAHPRLATIGALITLARWPQYASASLVAEVSQRAGALSRSADMASDPEARRAFGLVWALAAAFPCDPLVLAPLLVEPLTLTTGQLLLLPAGAPHAVLSGTAARFTPAEGSLAVAALRGGAQSTAPDLATVLGAVQGASVSLTSTGSGPADTAGPHTTAADLTRADGSTWPADPAVVVDPATGLPRVPASGGDWTWIEQTATAELTTAMVSGLEGAGGLDGAGGAGGTSPITGRRRRWSGTRPR